MDHAQFDTLAEDTSTSDEVKAKANKYLEDATAFHERLAKLVDCVIIEQSSVNRIAMEWGDAEEALEHASSAMHLARNVSQGRNDVVECVTRLEMLKKGNASGDERGGEDDDAAVLDDNDAAQEEV
ncbi:MAG: hypothetical protein SGPRY_011260 [Prymnesium sp.]